MKSFEMKSLTIAEVGALVAEHLRTKGIDCFLSGGAVVSIYTDNRYESFDLDFVSFSDRKKVHVAMEELGFKREKSRYYIHPETRYFVEFPGSSMEVGDDLVRSFEELKTKTGILKLLTPTDCVKDRLAAFYHWNDRQGLDQAVWVAKARTVDLEEIERWSKRAKKISQFLEFKDRVEL